jgi:hypothetical protein
LKVRQPDESPSALVVDGGFQLGMFSRPLDRVNPLDARLREGRDLPRFAKSLLLKEWQHFALVDDRFYVSLAIFDTKRIGLAQVIVYDRRTGSLVERERKLLSRDMVLPDSLWDAQASAHKGAVSIEVHNRLRDGFHSIEFRCGAEGREEALQGRFECQEDPSRHVPLVVCLPLSRHRAMYSHKGLFPLRGHLEIGGERHEFDPASSYCLVDVHKGYYPYVMKWKWATGAAVRAEGGLLGFNLTDNQVRDQERYNENALWVDGRMSLLPPVRFEMDPSAPERDWRVRDREGRVSLEFTPEAVRRVDLNLLILASRYRGPFGSFRGTIVADDGTSHSLDGAYGMCEDFYLRG